MQQAIALLTLIGWGTTVHAQTPKEKSIHYNELIAQASMACTMGNPARALPLYDSAFVLAQWNLSNYFEAAEAALASGRTDKANSYLLLGVAHGLDPTVYSDSIYDAFLASGGSKPFKDRLIEARMQFASLADSAVIKRLQLLVARDQQKRDGSPMEAHNDSLNFTALIALCGEKGFPVGRSVGNSAGIAWLLLWHHRVSYPGTAQWQQILPFIQAAIDAGELDPSFLCMFDDFTALGHGRPMPYGSLLGYYRNFPEKLYFIDRAQLNINRASVGWVPIEEAAYINGMDLASLCFAEP